MRLFPKHCWTFLPSMGLLIVLSVGYVGEANGWRPRVPLLYGVALRPFPTISGVDYPVARAQAWLEALGRAESAMPSDLAGRVRHLGLPLPLGLAALAALACPVEVVTPAHVSGPEVRVFLRALEPSRFEEALGNAWRLLMEMCLVWETRHTVRAMLAAWPKTATATLTATPQLEQQASLLAQLWLATQENALRTNGEGGGTGALQDASGSGPNGQEGATISLKPASSLGPSVALLLLHASESPHLATSVQLADRAIEICLEREVTDANRGLWNLLAAYGHTIRAQGHERQGQPALAEADLDTALGRMAKSGIIPELEAHTAIVRGRLRHKRGNLEGMCADYQSACALGECQPLAHARREGQCSP